ncbi:helix-turn-helix transcriptional regulator, partial [Sphingomonas carotinifaciens]
SLLSRGFRLMFGKSVAQYLAHTRLDAARRLLVTSDLVISSVGHACGYSNNAAFTRAFGRRFGVPPSVTRRQVHLPPCPALSER